MEKEELIAELKAAGIRHTPENILRIARSSDGRLVFLETGDADSGWQHIREDHANDFANRGISENQIQEAIMTAVINGRIVGTQGKSRTVYEVDFNGAIQYISVEVGSNGYIVGANPASRRLIRRFSQER